MIKWRLIGDAIQDNNNIGASVAVVPVPWGMWAVRYI